MFIWLVPPNEYDTQKNFDGAMKEKIVIFVLGGTFYSNEDSYNAFGIWSYEFRENVYWHG